MTKPRLCKIDDLTLPDYHYLEPDDRCYFVREYTSREDYSFSSTNDLISNFKKTMDRRGKAEWKYKERAILSIASEFRKLLPAESLSKMTLVPMPPSKAKDDPDHDDRMLRVLKNIDQEKNLDIRELILQNKSIPAVHFKGSYRHDPQELAEIFYIDEDISEPAPQKLAIFDDVLTTGAHFKAAQGIIQERYPGISVIGIFIARRIFNTDTDSE